MSTYFLFNHTESGRPHVLRVYNTERGALVGMRSMNRNLGFQRTARLDRGGLQLEACDQEQQTNVIAPYAVMEATLFDIRYPVKTRRVKNLMTGEYMDIPEDTPHCCDPSTERYWSM
jgi:hypothetical protein